MTLPDAAAAEIRAHAEREFPREACGLLAVIKGRLEYVPCRNIAQDQNEQFGIAPEDLADVEDQGEIVGIVHSHPNVPARPSAADKVQCEASGLPWHIVHVSIPDGEENPKAGEIYSFEPTGYQAPLVNRPFVHGILDCYTLIRDYFAREKGIVLPNFQRSDGWWERGENLYVDQYEQAGFVQVPAESLRKDDVILMAIRSKVPNHGAVYLGDELILHHLYNRLSSRDLYGGYWQEMTCRVVRHKDLM